MKTNWKNLYITIHFLLLCITVQAQETPTEDHSYKPLTLKLNESGSKYLRLVMWHQFWVTATQNNPGTKDVNGLNIDGSNGSKEWSSDIALRRSRLQMIAQISPRFLFVSHWGVNNQSFINGGTPPSGPNATSSASNQGKKPTIFIHDAWTEFRIIPEKLYIGAGLIYWNGISRLSSHSTLNFMTLDAPIFNWSNIEATDQFARQFGIYAKGQFGKFDYRVSLNKPFVFGNSPSSIEKNGVSTHVYNENYATAGYLHWFIWDKEPNILPYFVGSHLGTKKVLNLGVGWYNHTKASLYKTDTDSTYYNETTLGADLFLDMPLNREKGTAISVLATMYIINYGPNYLRNVGILNNHPSTSTAISFAGGGNAQPMIGTGTIGYVQAGYLLPKLRNETAFMPYLTATYKDFERLKTPSFQWALGLNYFVTGHNAKITLEYATRPIYKSLGSDIVRDGSKGQFTLQSHIYL
ncbi:MAG: hypothetical protein WAT79_09115 [Saprospiraceae bacterium]